jgi:putative ABC transport system permease protein
VLDFLLSNIGQGLIYAPIVLGVYITYSILDFPDLSVDGTFPLGAAVTAVCVVSGMNPLLAMLLAIAAGAAAGYVTGALHVYLKITNLLCGILTMTALYSVNLHIMGKANIALSSKSMLFPADVTNPSMNLLNSVLIALAIVVVVKVLLDLYMTTFAGKSLLAVGANEQLVKTLAINTGRLKITGLMLANGLAALSGSMMAQYQRFADVGMGSGTVVIGLAAVIIGRAVFSRARFIQGSTSVIFGSIIYKLAIGAALKLGLPAEDMKIMTAVFFVLVIVLQNPAIYKKLSCVFRGGRSDA